MNIFAKGSKPLSIIDIETSELDCAIPTEFALIQNLYLDYCFLDVDNNIHHVEFQTTYQSQDVYRFQLYNALLRFKYKDLVNNIYTYIVFHADIKPKKGEIMQLKESGSSTFTPKVVYMHGKSAEDSIHKIWLKVKYKEHVRLTQDEIATLLFSLFMQRHGSLEDLSRNIMEIVNKHSDEEQKIAMTGAILALGRKALDESGYNKLEEAVINMGKLMDHLQKNVWDKAEVIGSEKKLMELIRIKLGKGKDYPQIADELEISIEEVEELIKKYGLEM